MHLGLNEDHVPARLLDDPLDLLSTRSSRLPKRAFISLVVVRGISRSSLPQERVDGMHLSMKKVDAVGCTLTPLLCEPAFAFVRLAFSRTAPRGPVIVRSTGQLGVLQKTMDGIAAR